MALIRSCLFLRPASLTASPRAYNHTVTVISPNYVGLGEEQTAPLPLPPRTLRACLLNGGGTEKISVCDAQTGLNAFKVTDSFSTYKQPYKNGASDAAVTNRGYTTEEKMNA